MQVKRTVLQGYSWHGRKVWQMVLRQQHTGSPHADSATVPL